MKIKLLWHSKCGIQNNYVDISSINQDTRVFAKSYQYSFQWEMENLKANSLIQLSSSKILISKTKDPLKLTNRSVSSRAALLT